VQAPFAAPPTERDRKRTWISLGIGGAIVLLCCVGGILGIGGLVVAEQRAIPAEARTVVRTYLDGLRDNDYHKSYNVLCSPLKQRESYTEFANRHRAESQVRTYTISDPQPVGSRVLVPTTIQTVDGTGSSVQFTLISDQRSGALRICGTSR
jgi:hypothetical protein